MLVECLIRVVDKVGTTQRLDAGLTKDGDAIVIQRSPGIWGIEDFANPDWRIVLIDLTATQVDALLAAETGEFAYRDNRKRKFRLNTGAMTPYIHDNPTGIVDLTDMNMNALIMLKGEL